MAALRRDGKKDSLATETADTREPFIGFGNPLLTGSSECGKIIVPDKCPDSEVQLANTDPSDAARDAGDAGAVQDYFRNGLADVAAAVLEGDAV